MSTREPGRSARRDPNWNFRAVGLFVPKATARAREAHGLHTADIILNWAAIVGPALAAYTAPRRIRWPKAPDRIGTAPKPSPRGMAQKTTLEIWVAGGRAHEIPYLKASILARINAYFGYRAVTDVLPVDGPILRPRPPARPQPPRPEDVQAVAEAHGLAPADPLAAALARLGANVARRARSG